MTRYGPPTGSLFGMDADQGTEAHLLSRSDDPATSKEAAAKMVGKLAADRAYALDCVTKNPGWTSAELEAHYKPHPSGRIRKRLAELERAGLVWRGVVRTCRVNGTKAAIWWPVERSGT